MRYVIIRDDDTNALTPVDYLESLYRPFLDRRLPINLSVIPNVNTRATMENGQPEEFLLTRRPGDPPNMPIGSNRELTDYLQRNSGYQINQHGYQHDFQEFNMADPKEIARRLDGGLDYFREAGFARPRAFIAPHDVISRPALYQIAKRFPIISKNWYELSGVPLSWWPSYLMKKFNKTEHWTVGHTLLLGRPKPYLADDYESFDHLLEDIKKVISTRRVTVLITHWWSFFKNQERGDRLKRVLHQAADYFVSDPNIKVISFGDLIDQQIPLN
jgi:Uncharacterized protein conserved in bacteria (DUF2334)